MTQLPIQIPFGSRDALLSTCGRYRYALERSTGLERRESLCWLMLNPSTADATSDDPTIRKVVGFTRRVGYGCALVVNLFAWRATDKREVIGLLRGVFGPVQIRVDQAEGPGNRIAIMRAATISAAVVCAWGAHPWARSQAARVLAWLTEVPEGPRPLLCLGTSRDGDPLHPLMPSYDGHPLVPFTFRGATPPRRLPGEPT